MSKKIFLPHPVVICHRILSSLSPEYFQKLVYFSPQHWQPQAQLSSSSLPCLILGVHSPKQRGHHHLVLAFLAGEADLTLSCLLSSFKTQLTYEKAYTASHGSWDLATDPNAGLFITGPHPPHKHLSRQSFLCLSTTWQASSISIASVSHLCFSELSQSYQPPQAEILCLCFYLSWNLCTTMPPCVSDVFFTLASIPLGGKLCLPWPVSGKSHY